MKKSVIGLALAAMLSLGYTDSYASDNKVTKQISIECVRGRGTVFHKSQELGEKDLAGLVLSAKAEDSWLYWNGTWVDIGYNERSNGVSIFPIFDNVIAGPFDKIKKDDLVVDYHIHPAADYSKFKREVLPLLSVKDIISHYRICSALESYGIKTKSRVVDEFGILEYSIDDSLYSRFNRSNKEFDKVCNELDSELQSIRALSDFNKFSFSEIRKRYYDGLMRKGVIINMFFDDKGK